MYKAIDLFAGAGGLSYGFHLTGQYEFVAAAEIKKDARNTYEKNLVRNRETFKFIDNVIGYDFVSLKQQNKNEIDVVIGGPPCQGFSNANRQKNHLISKNNSLVKEFFRAIQEILPKVFVMENVSMLRSNVHRFYESKKDNDLFATLAIKGKAIPMREDLLLLSTVSIEGVDMSNISSVDLADIEFPEPLSHNLSVLKKNLNNNNKLAKFLKKNASHLSKQIADYIEEKQGLASEPAKLMIKKLECLRKALLEETHNLPEIEIDYVVETQRLISSIREIETNELIGNFEYTLEKGLFFRVRSYSVIDYINVVLGDSYVQTGKVMNAKWFGVPQDRERYVLIGIRNDVYREKGIILELPGEPDNLRPVTVGEAILDLCPYEASYDYRSEPIEYMQQGSLSAYATWARRGSTCVRNQITTKTTETALARFRKITQGKNFHSLEEEDKKTYAKPERTQNTIYLRLDPNKPSGTVVNVRKSMWIHPLLNRAVTVREAARLQSFPDCFEFVGSKDSQYQQVGNAVPPLLAKAIAGIVLRFL